MVSEDISTFSWTLMLGLKVKPWSSSNFQTLPETSEFTVHVGWCLFCQYLHTNNKSVLQPQSQCWIFAFIHVVPPPGRMKPSPEICTAHLKSAVEIQKISFIELSMHGIYTESVIHENRWKWMYNVVFYTKPVGLQQVKAFKQAPVRKSSVCCSHWLECKLLWKNLKFVV